MNRLETFNKMTEVELWTTKSLKKKFIFMSNLLPENFRAYSSPNKPHLTKSKIININFYLDLT